MSKICCDICAYWLPQFKECGNTHINKCTNKEHFVKVQRNCGTCEREIEAKAIDEFAERMKKMCKGIAIAEKGIDEIAKQMKAGVENKN